MERLLPPLLDFQTESGSWYYLADRPRTGECAKATAAMAHYLTQALLSETIPQRLRSRSLASARLAVRWCEAHQELNNKTLGYGGIHSWTTEGAIAGARNADVSFIYTAAFYLLAKRSLLEIETRYYES